MRDKASVEIDEAKETLELFDGHGLRIVSDGLDMRGKGRDTGEERTNQEKSGE